MRSSFFIPLVWFAVATIGVFIAHFAFAVRWTASLGGAAIILVAVFVNGLIATREDELPGGFNNPTPKQTEKDSHDDNAA